MTRYDIVLGKKYVEPYRHPSERMIEELMSEEDRRIFAHMRAAAGVEEPQFDGRSKFAIATNAVVA